MNQQTGNSLSQGPATPHEQPAAQLREAAFTPTSPSPEFPAIGSGLRTALQREQYVLFGPIGEDTYRAYAPGTPNDPNYAIAKLHAAFGENGDGAHAAVREERLRYWGHYAELKEHLSAESTLPVLDQIRAFVRRTSPMAAGELGEQPSGLGAHLKEITQFCNSFFLTNQGAIRFPNVLSDRQAALVAEVAAPLHDLLKYLGSPKAQLMPDHEIVTAELVRKHFEDKTVLVLGHPTRLDRTDVEFLATVIGDHENIEKELGRSERIHSDDPKERAKALFFVADVLTGVIVPDQSQPARWSLDPAQLEARFVDLYFRHIDPVQGKIFRPEWGLHALRDLSTTLGALVSDHGLDLTGATPGSNVEQSLAEAGVRAVDRAFEADHRRWAEAGRTHQPQPEKFLSEAQLDRMREVRQTLAEKKVAH